MERIGKGGTLIRQSEQILVWNDDQRVNIGLQFFNAFVGLFHPALALKFKWLGDNANGQNAAFTRSAGNNRCGACAGAATHACGDKHHVAISQFSHHILQAFFSGQPANLGL